MWRFALLCSVLTLTAACGDVPGAPSVNTDGLSLVQEGDPPPPPLDGDGSVLFSSRFAAAAAVTQEGCVPPPEIFVALEGDYFQNKPGNNARLHFSPFPGTGSGSGTIHETANNPDPTASGTLVVMVDDVQVRIHLLDYVGRSLFLYQPGDFSGFTVGDLVAEVNACGEKTTYDGVFDFGWFCFECGKD